MPGAVSLSPDTAMEETTNANFDEKVKKDAGQLAKLLKEMKEGLDTVTSKVQALTAKVKANNLRTADGLSYLETKHLLLLEYCQYLVYYLLRKAKGFSIEDHPVVRSLVEARLFLEKIRPIDKKLQYQLQKLTRVAGESSGNVGLTGKESDGPPNTEDLLKYRPNPDMLVSKTDMTSEGDQGVYRPPKFAPALMEEDKMSKEEKNAFRKEKLMLRQAKQSAFVKDLINDVEGRPEEHREIIGVESMELTRYKAQMEERARREEEQFTRAPVTKWEKKREKHLKKSRNGLLGLADDFYDEVKSLSFGDSSQQTEGGSSKRGVGMRRSKKQKRR